MARKTTKMEREMTFDSDDCISAAKVQAYKDNFGYEAWEAKYSLEMREWAARFNREVLDHPEAELEYNGHMEIYWGEAESNF